MVDSDNECYIMETAFIIGLEGPLIDTDVITYQAYNAIKTHMMDGSFDVPHVVSCRFVSPDPLLPPPAGNEDSTANNSGSSNLEGSDTANPLAVGFSVFAVMSVVIVSLLMWKSRRSNQHHQLLFVEEITPWVTAESDNTI